MDIKEFTKAELEAWFLNAGEKPFRAWQVLKWLYQRGAETFAAMTDLPSPLRTVLSQEFTIGRLSCLHLSPANDGTRKFLQGFIQACRTGGPAP